MKSNGRNKSPDGTDVWRGLAAGLVGGLVASWTMNQFQAFTTELAKEMEKSQGEKKKREEPEKKEGDDATVKVASAISEGIFDHKLTKKEKKVAGPAVHYAFGTITGGFYGAAAELAPLISRGPVYHSVRSSGSRRTKQWWPRSASRIRRPNTRSRRTLPRLRRTSFTD